MHPEKHNPTLLYGFTANRDFLLIEKNLGHKFDQEDLANINILLQSDKDLIIQNFHNFFALNEEKSLEEIERRLAKDFDSEEEKQIATIFHALLKKYNWTISLNLESFIEEN
jgi:hypothetical protein